MPTLANKFDDLGVGNGFLGAKRGKRKRVTYFVNLDYLVSKWKGYKMGWEKGSYYTRSKKINGRVVREYLVKGLIGKMASQMDEEERERRQQDAFAWNQEKQRLNELDSQLVNLIELADLLARAALVCAGYHQHNRSEWRRKRYGKPSGS